MKHSKIPLSQTAVQLCKLYGYKHVVISPGSRNAPLTIGFTEDPYFDCFSIVDERSAAFFALGMSQQINIPTILVCTSGSAVLNYYPAIAEAYYSQIPLIILSADRPEHLIDIGDGQTIRQIDVFGNHIVYNASLKLDIDPNADGDNLTRLPIFKNLNDKVDRFLGIQKDIQVFNESEINKAFTQCIAKLGPVHLNLPFSEPLYETTSQKQVNPIKLQLSDDHTSLDSDYIEKLANDWNRYKKKIVLIGVLSPDTIVDPVIDTLAKDPGVLIFTETTSNIHHNNIFPSIDKIIAPLNDMEFKELQPDLILTIGGMVVSKKIKAFLRKYQPQQHWHLGLNKANDTFFKLNEHIRQPINSFLESFLTKVDEKTGNFRAKWDLIKEKREKKHQEYLDKIEFSDLKVFDRLISFLPSDSILQLSNSATIRYSQLFDMPKSVEVFCNRGTSGIDGSTSTAIGCAVVRNKQTIFITGDLSFFYDSNALWNDYIPSSFRIIVINNGGGGIFRILPGNKNTENFDRYFETTHSLSCEQLCEMYGFDYYMSGDEISLNKELQSFFKEDNRPKLLEVFTPKDLNDEILLQYFEAIK